MNYAPMPPTSMDELRMALMNSSPAIPSMSPLPPLSAMQQLKSAVAPPGAPYTTGSGNWPPSAGGVPPGLMQIILQALGGQR